LNKGIEKTGVPSSGEPETRPERSFVGSAPFPQTPSNQAADLRRLAEDLARGKTAQSPDDSQARSPEEMRRLLHELRVHQIELEMQNDELRRSQADLEASRERYFDLYDLAPVGYFTLSEPGLILQVNLTAAALLGVSRDALVQQPLTRFIFPEDQDIFYRHCRQLFETGLPQACEMRMLRTNADPFWVRLDATFVRDADGTAYGRAVMSDITEQKRALEARQETELQHQFLFENMLNGLAYCRMIYEGDQPIDFVYLFVNSAFESQTGLKGVTGRKVSEVIPGIRKADRDLLEIYGRVARTGVPEKFEIHLEAMDMWFAVSVYSPRRDHFVAVFDVITERKHYEHERETTLTLMRLLNSDNNTRDLIGTVTDFLQEWSGFEAVGVRLKDGDDYPYYETRGFTKEFVELENTLCARDLDGQLIRDGIGNPVLECMCGNILCGRFDPKLPFFTEKGSFWSNCTTDLLASTTEAERQSRTRNRCNGEGYESVGLIPLRFAGTTYGLLQLNDHRKGRFNPKLLDLVERLADSIATALAQRQSQAALRDSEAKYRKLHESMRDAFCEVDMTGRFVECNTAYETITGYTRTELHALTYPELTPPQWHDMEANIVAEEILKKGFSRVYEKEYIRKDGTVFPVELRSFLIRDGKGDPCAIWAIVRDVTDRKRAEESLKQTNMMLAQTQEISKVGGWDYDVASGKGNWTDEVYQIYGVEKTQAPKDLQSAISFYTPQSRHLIERAFRLAVEQGRPYDLELDFIQADGKPMWVRTIGRPVVENGKTVRVVGNIMDITERKRLEEQLHNRQIELNHAQRLSTAGELASNLAHELNQPLTAILSQAERCLSVLGDDPPGSDKLSEKLDRIVQQAQRAGKIIATMRHFIRRDPERMEPIDLNGSIREVLELMEIERRRFQICIDLDLAPEMPLISGVAIQIQQVLVNVLQNAFEAMEDTPPAERSVTVATRVQSESVILNICDRGKGIYPDQKDQLFDPFYTTKPNGLGLGLPLCRSILERLGGSIQVIQNTDCGVTVQIVMPLGMPFPGAITGGNLGDKV
jgi:PAS domain S-box-containing protein